jgi:uncharacterized membrane protein YraQ (UPF0718 family)
MKTVLSEIIGILNESSIYLLLGFALAGVLHVVLTRFPRLTALFTGKGARPVFMSAFLGLPMPLCSCSVLPAAMTLRRKGASKGATASFLVSVPETDIVSILLTLALLGGVMAVYRPMAALATAVLAGLVINALDRRGEVEAPAPSTPVASCCCDDEASPAESGSIMESSDDGPWYKRALRYGFVKIFDDIIAQLFLGIVIAGVLMTWLPGIEAVSATRGAVWTYALMLVIGVPVYVCAVASTPVAAGLIAGGVSPGAAMVFLLAGPATNIASLFVLRGEFGKRLLAVYLVAIAVASVAAGVAFDAFLGHTVSAADIARRHHEHGAGAKEIAATVVFLILVLASFHRTNLLGRIRTRISGTPRNAPE